MRPLSELPNTEGFRFVGIRRDGSRVECTLHYQDPDGNMSLRLRACNDRVDCESELAGWDYVEDGWSYANMSARDL